MSSTSAARQLEPAHPGWSTSRNGRRRRGLRLPESHTAGCCAPRRAHLCGTGGFQCRVHTSRQTTVDYESAHAGNCSQTVAKPADTSVMERTFADAPILRTPHECTKNDIGGRWRNQAEAPFKQRVLGSSPRRLTFPCGSRALALFRQHAAYPRRPPDTQAARAKSTTTRRSLA